MKELKDIHSSSHLKMRQSTSEPNVFINNRGDRVKFESANKFIVNGDPKFGVTNMLKSVGKFGK